jgi:hypothetical protein
MPYNVIVLCRGELLRLDAFPSSIVSWKVRRLWRAGANAPSWACTVSSVSSGGGVAVLGGCLQGICDKVAEQCDVDPAESLRISLFDKYGLEVPQPAVSTGKQLENFKLQIFGRP